MIVSSFTEHSDRGLEAQISRLITKSVDFVLNG